jgi:hypothetical protein
MVLQERIDAFVELGKNLQELLDGNSPTKGSDLGKILEASVYNEWFTKEHIKFSLKAIAESLTSENIANWLSKYPKIEKAFNKKIGVVTAGNIPLVGFHDLLCVLIAGNELIIKMSSKDDKLFISIIELLIEQNPEFKKLIRFEKEQLKDFDAIIATGSDNTSKYFEYYFGKYPNIIRKNRNSVAVLTGEETEEELNGLADDIMMYFGLGCRNVSKLYLPEGYDIQRVFKALYQYKHFVDHNKYSNNYTYNKSIYLMEKTPFWENGFTILKEDIGMASPISVIYFENYKTLQTVKERLNIDKENIQCVAAKDGLVEGSVAFGKAQQPELWDYADNVDTMEFLLELGH